MGSASTTYISIPDVTATSTAGDQCQGVSGLPSLPADWTYHCAASSTYANTDGTGWIPVNLGVLTGGSPISVLPIDPTNSVTSNLYYTYQTNGSQYELTATVESQKYQAKAVNDGGRYSDLYEYGTKLSLAPVDYKSGGGGGSTSSLTLANAIHWSNDNNAVTSVTSTSMTNTSGNFLTISVFWKNDVTISSVSGNGNTYADSGAGRLARPTDGYLETYYAANVNGGSNVITVNFSGSATEVDWYIEEWSGAALASPIDGNATGTATSGTSVTSAAIATTNSNDMLYAFGVSNDCDATADTNFTLAQTVACSAEITEYRNVTSTGSYTATANWSSAITKAGIIEFAIKRRRGTSE
jgi:hypothetical protein